jgi:hypothetical protein
MSEAIYLAWSFLFIGIVIVASGNYTAAVPRDYTLARPLAGVALIIFALLRLFHVI